MKEIMAYYAKCNKVINKAMNDVIINTIKDPYSHKLDGYFFKCLSDILEHIFIADMIWLKAFMDVQDFGLNIEKDVGPIPGYGEKAFARYEEYLVSREKLDDFIIKYMNSLTDDIFAKTVSRVSRAGAKIEKEVAKALVHFFNHQTHHRGQISNILDTMNIENNYSNMIFVE